MLVSFWKGVGRGRGQLGWLAHWGPLEENCSPSGRAGQDSIPPGGSPWWTALGSFDLVMWLFVGPIGANKGLSTWHTAHHQAARPSG